MTTSAAADPAPHNTRAPIDPLEYREVMGHYPTGVAVVTGLGAEGEPIGMVVGTFTAVSLEPPLVAFMPTIGSGTYALMREAGRFCINVLAHDQLELCRLMAVPRPGKFDDVDWASGANGAPVLADAVAHIECTLHEEVVAGDHYIVLCAIEAMTVTRPVTPLLFFQGGYGGFNPKGMTAQGDGEIISAIRLAEVARPDVDRVAREIGCEAGILVGINDHEVTTAYTTFGGGAQMEEALGERILLMPPLGEGYVAWRPEQEIEQWIERTSSKDEEVRAKYRRRLSDVRERGYALSVVEGDSPHDYEELKQAMREYAAGQLTPAREREVRGVIAGMSPFFETLDLEDDSRYDLGSIVVPVLGPDGMTVMVIRARQLPAQALGSQVRGWVTSLQEGARRVENRLRTGASDTFESYRDAFPSSDYMM